ncbi:uncharacterized protein LOC131157337 isoform X2 [Malania oleifera]|uniref:uncharacterized protein LOC131157337 isoform X2 n=1 Tax=Malania oleifera TaxID=397392 RepID=UPI0025AE5A8B|nr:uncharacterized protein LOC131157337 isoform X2 [Malania oleifera]
MPRPGPRPYECVRRAWHSDRHQPMRGSIIQQIFRVVNESHSPATKKNKEWQEKLPIVVLKSEEIMYSKANSEVEYMNLETLWDRVNDAINTIIRRDESTETGELLPPCIEAALNLGCIPVRASRSQRHSNPRSYLSPRVQEPPSAPSRILDNTINKQCPQLRPLHSRDQLTFARPATVDSAHLVSESNRPITQNNNPSTTSSFPFRHENFPSGGKQSMTMEANTSLNFGSVYPLYYGTQYQTEKSQLCIRNPVNMNSNNIFDDVPISSPIAEHVEKGVLQNLFTCDRVENALDENAQEDFSDIHQKSTEIECDLSLRLGLFSDSCMSMEKRSVRDTEDVGSSGSQDGSKFSDVSAHKNEFCFFPLETASDPFVSCSSGWKSEGKGQNVEATSTTHEASFCNILEDGQFCWQPELPSDQFTGQLKRPEN